jgi:quinoprotein glucose dehydrogenase
MRRFSGAILLFLLLLAVAFVIDPDPDKSWPEYLGGPDRNHYSPLTQINTQNVKELVKAWEYHTGDSGQIQCNPIIIDGVMYGMTAATITVSGTQAARTIAFNAATTLTGGTAINLGNASLGAGITAPPAPPPACAVMTQR